MHRLEVACKGIVTFLFCEIIVFCSVASYLLINIESSIVLFIFDFLFVSLAFQLTKTLPLKLGLLALGNAVGLFCNYLFHTFSVVGMEYLGEAFRVFYAISFPVLSVSWMVIFWSLSLTAIPKPANIKTGDRNSAA